MTPPPKATESVEVPRELLLSALEFHADINDCGGHEASEEDCYWCVQVRPLLSTRAPAQEPTTENAAPTEEARCGETLRAPWTPGQGGPTSICPGCPDCAAPVDEESEACAEAAEASAREREKALEDGLREITAFVGRLRGGDKPGPTEVLVHWNRARALLARGRVGA